MASSYADPQALINAYRNNAGALRQIENLVLEDQVVDHVLSHARVHEVKSTFKDVMNFG